MLWLTHKGGMMIAPYKLTLQEKLSKKIESRKTIKIRMKNSFII